MAFMLDTNICIYIIKQKPASIISRMTEISPSDVSISSITFSELWFGAVKSSKPEQNRSALIQFVAPFDILPYDDDAAYHYGIIRAHLEKRGTPIGPLDMLIAAHCLSLNRTLVTHNMKEFRRVPGLSLVNWVD